MRIIAIKTIKNFWSKSRYQDSEQSLKSWVDHIKKVKWQKSHDVKNKYPKASIIDNNRVVFNINGNKYRLIVSIKYEFQIIFIRFIGTHDEYDKINAKDI